MSVIAVVDDREGMRTSLVRAIQVQLVQMDVGWAVLGIAPLPDLNDYPAWLRQHDVVTLVLDEKLGEGHVNDANAVDYDGHSVAMFLRARVPDLPMFIVTSIDDFDDSDESASQLEAIVQRADFRKQRKKYVSRMVRAGQRFSERNMRELARIDEISRKLVNGDASKEDLDELAGLRIKTHNEFSFEAEQSMNEWVGRAEELCVQLESIVAEAGK